MGRSDRDHSVFSCIIVCSVTIFRTTDGGSITWFDPPPSETVTDSSIISAVNQTLTKGFPNEELSCNFNLTADLSLITASMKYDASTIATYLESQQALSVEPTFVRRLNATWVPNKLTLILFSVTDADKGEYRCEVVTFGGPVQTWIRTIQVSLLVPPIITEITGTSAIEGTNVTLKCLAKGKPTPSIRWTRLFDNLTVTMPLINIRREDAPAYRCTAHNGVGTSAFKDVSIDVLYPVKAKGPGENVSVTEGEVTILSCPVEGNPQPSITWYRLGGAKISSGKKLTLKGRIEESGCYICVANNSLGMPVTVSQCLVVIGKEVPTAFTTATGAPDSVSEGPPWTVIGIVVGVGVVLLVIVIGVVTWWMRKKRKSRKETKQGELQHLEDDHKDNLEGLQ